ncbi:glycosyltransferase 87 family protein [Dictyobacter arantiisoli]|uniref:DUF2029 domain-containing protein n=1 Tax=Dictyobacter arantiisoli TaxID=2014874 RepID=A0A5A5TH25_9CHLR|nr:glycosyltransferase 87 family protein [Dictyobacter arantiisoli]GCF10264.1 hypothetical protein KDI_38280 [Dictyobacter arantiisoli]
MSLMDFPATTREHHVFFHWKNMRRLPVLCLLLLLAAGYNIFLALVVPPAGQSTDTFAWLWLLSLLLYVAASIVILTTQRSTGRRGWLELALILGGALLLRAQLLWIPPLLSRDSWRYLWDARVTLHGYSPYVYAPGNVLLKSLRNVLYDNSRFRNVPTIYPPVAQGFYLLSYLLAPDNLVFLKGLFTVCELVSVAALAYLLHTRGRDPALCIIYAWCPLPIVEFAIQGHLDALVVMFLLLTVLAAQSQRRGARVLTGFLLALATLTKLYPIVLLAVFLRRRDWTLLVTCILTIVVAYMPYIILGHGQVFGFFASYASEQGGTNGGSIMLFMHWLSGLFALPLPVTYVVDVLFVGGCALFVWLRRLQGRLSMEVGILIILGAIFLISTHIFPWYTSAFLPWVALLIGSPWSRRAGWQSRELSAILVWYFVCFSILSYPLGSQRNWTLYYRVVYDVVLGGLVVTFVLRKISQRRGFTLLPRPVSASVEDSVVRPDTEVDVKTEHI